MPILIQIAISFLSNLIFFLFQSFFPSYVSTDNSEFINKFYLNNFESGGQLKIIEGSTSNEMLKEFFKNPLDIKFKNSKSTGDTILIDLDVDDEIEIEEDISVDTDWGSFNFNSDLGKMILGEGLDKTTN